MRRALASGVEGKAMIKRFDHFTIVVEDEAEAKRFFEVVGFREQTSVVISGERFADYMGVPDGGSSD